MLAANPTQGQHVTFPRYCMFSKAWMLRSWRFKRCQGDLGVKPFQGDTSIVWRSQAAPALPTPRGLSPLPLEQIPRVRASPYQASAGCLEVSAAKGDLWPGQQGTGRGQDTLWLWF